jgi:hypothetical protein
LLPFGLGVVVWAYAHRGARPGPIAFVLGVWLALLVSSVLVQTRDVEARRTMSVSRALVQSTVHPSKLFAPITTKPDAEMVPAFAAALQVIPNEFRFGYGKWLLRDLITRPVPRQLWPHKPFPPREQVIDRLWPQEYVSRTANPEFSVLLALYMDAGAVGIAIGMALLGAGARVLYEWFMDNSTSLHAQVVFALSLGVFIDALRDSPVDSAIRFAFLAGPLFAIFRYARFASSADKRSGYRLWAPQLAGADNRA